MGSKICLVVCVFKWKLFLENVSFFYLNHVGRGEPESVKARDENLVRVLRLPELAHDRRLGRAASVVDQDQLGVGGAVHGDQVADEDLVRGILKSILEMLDWRVAFLIYF